MSPAEAAIREALANCARGGNTELRGIAMAQLNWACAGNIDALLSELDALRAENANLRTVMVAAAEEIAAHWDAHCDAEGYGPQNLQRRLEEGIPSEYGYTAGAFAALRARCEAAEAAAAAKTMPTVNKGQCPMCGEYSMSARAHQGLYGNKVDL